MLRIPETDPIEFLIERKFSNYQELRSVLTATREGGTISRDCAQQQLKEVAVYEAELKAKPREELLMLYEEAKEKHRRVRNLVTRARNFNQLSDLTSPGLFLAWAKRNGIDFPPELLRHLRNNGRV